MPRNGGTPDRSNHCHEIVRHAVHPVSTLLSIGRRRGMMQCMITPNHITRAASCTFAYASLILLAACQSGTETGQVAAFSGIEAEEVIYFTGTEPFWGGEAAASQLTYSTPENPAGAVITVQRFTGNHGLGLSGRLGNSAFDMTVTPGECSDGMSDRAYPMTVTLSIGGNIREGCGWTDRQPFTGADAP